MPIVISKDLIINLRQTTCRCSLHSKIILPVMAAAYFIDMAPVLAAGGHGHEHDAASGGLPQLDIATYPSQLFWLLIFFVGLYVIFAKAILPVISATIQNRSIHIQEDMDVAERLTKEAEQAQQAYEEKLSSAREQATKMYKEVTDEVNALKTQEWDKMRGRWMTAEDKLSQEIASSTNDVMAEMNDIAAEIAQEAASKIVGIDMDLDTARRAVEGINSNNNDAAKKGKAA